MDRLLKRQLIRYFGSDYENRQPYCEQPFQDFITAIDQAYSFNRKELSQLERTLELNSEELNSANQRLKEQNDAIGYLAKRDSLTGLANRRDCHDKVTEALVRAENLNRKFALLFIDLDRFKRINDTLGHHVGDELLRQVGQRLISNVRVDDIVSRLGGDEFTILLDNIENEEIAERIASKLLGELAKPYLIDDKEVNVTASIGIGLYPQSGKDVLDVFKIADTAMYQVKQNGRNNFLTYNPDMHANAMHDLEVESLLRHAIENNELSVVYQPKLEISSGKLCGMEALLRWHNSVLGEVSPISFIPIAETSGLIISIGTWILNQACMQMAAWQEKGLGNLSVAVNIAVAQLAHEDFTSSINNAIQLSGLSPKYLELEITESMIMRSDDVVMRNIDEIKKKGISLSIDDFGTGYSSLSAIRQYPIDSLKIDRSFVRTVTENDDDAAIVTAIVAMSRSLHLKVIAEGVETSEQLAHMVDAGCDVIQGYLVARPLTVAAMEKLLESDPDYNDMLAPSYRQSAERRRLNQKEIA